MMPKYYVVRPYGRDKGRESTIVFEGGCAEAAFAEIDRLAEQMARTGVAPETLELLVADQARRIVTRPVH
jgi:hypothetical protein